jgi:hypothetical protein
MGERDYQAMENRSCQGGDEIKPTFSFMFIRTLLNNAVMLKKAYFVKNIWTAGTVKKICRKVYAAENLVRM